MNGQSIREAAMATPKKTQDVATPFWPTTDGQVAIADQDMGTLTAMRELAKTDPAGYPAALICKVLISKETGDPVFADADRDWIKGQASVVMALIHPINEFFGFETKAAVEAAKNA
ncbi:hypothetical protein ccbrp13_56360 [Ktedonobacteria bacterium brp13]|nr:hypothetical protein ccbrp13_56360 [Ktedonobacteria bacterium brp13]